MKFVVSFPVSDDIEIKSQPRNVRVQPRHTRDFFSCCPRSVSKHLVHLLKSFPIRLWEEEPNPEE